MNYFASNLKFLRKTLSVSQSYIASVIAKGQTTIGNWENKRTEPDIEELIKISRFFGISLDALVLVNFKKDNILTREHIQEFNHQREIHEKVLGAIQRISGNKNENDNLPGEDPDSAAILSYLKIITEKLKQLEELLNKQNEG